MDELIKFLSSPIVSRKDKTIISLGTLVAMGVGAMALYYSVPQRKRRNIF